MEAARVSKRRMCRGSDVRCKRPAATEGRSSGRSVGRKRPRGAVTTSESGEPQSPLRLPLYPGFEAFGGFADLPGRAP
jgi:hypothetical protein